MLTQEKIRSRFYFKSCQQNNIRIFQSDHPEKELIKKSSFYIVHDEMYDITEVTSIDNLPVDFFKTLNNIDILIIGTGTHQQFPEQALYQELSTFPYSIDFMANDACCRTYNILINEERKVAILLLQKLSLSQ